MTRKMFEKAGLIPGLQGIPKPGAERAPAGDSPKPKTAPGTMMGFLTAQSGAVQEAEELRARVKSLEGAAPLRKLNPSEIRSSKWANRHEASYRSEDFVELKAEIAASGGNVQPIKVRPVPVLNGSTDTDGAGFELIFGHRRHRACAELGLPVLAAIEETTDVSLFEQMERENRGRKSLSAWEQGMMYRRALDDGLFVSQRKLSEHLGVDVSLVSKSLSLARLPDSVISAFASPLDIQFRWAQPLSEVLQKDPDGMVKRATALKDVRDNLKAREVFERLISAPKSTPAPAPVSKSERFGAPGKGANLRMSKNGKMALEIDAGALEPKQCEELRLWLRKVLPVR